MHYYQFNIGDYRRKTHYLSILEHGIYRLLIDTYYLEERPLCEDHATLMRTHCIRTKEEQNAFETVIKDFFVLTDEGYRHSVCDKTIEKYAEKSAKASASARARWGKDANAMRTHSERYANHKPITNNHKPIDTPSKPVCKTRFEEYWKAYPKKTGKKKCAEIWKRRKLDSLAELIIADVTRRRIDDSQWCEGFIPNPQTYLNGDRWEDEIQTKPKNNNQPGNLKKANLRDYL